jgi:hypothetical protein
VQGTVTLDVDRMPLRTVLGLIGEQVEARWTTVYPIYTEKTALISLKRALRGEANFADTRFPEGRPRPFGRGPRAEGNAASELVTLNLSNTELTLGALALERFGGGQVVVEKGTTPAINLELSGVPFEKAVEEIAQSAHRHSTRLYALQAARRPEPRDLAANTEPRPRPASENPERAAKMQQVQQLLPDEQRKRDEERQLERAAMQSLTPEQRSQVMAERMNSPEMQVRQEQRSISGIKNSTPEQRHERYERMYQMRKARAAATTRNG